MEGLDRAQLAEAANPGANAQDMTGEARHERDQAEHGHVEFLDRRQVGDGRQGEEGEESHDVDQEPHGVRPGSPGDDLGNDRRQQEQVTAGQDRQLRHPDPQQDAGHDHRHGDHEDNWLRVVPRSAAEQCKTGRGKHAQPAVEADDEERRGPVDQAQGNTPEHGHKDDDEHARARCVPELPTLDCSKATIPCDRDILLGPSRGHDTSNINVHFKATIGCPVQLRYGPSGAARREDLRPSGEDLEATSGFEPLHRGFAVSGLASVGVCR